MTRDAQKDEELSYLDEFLRKQLALKVVSLSPALKEPPDGSAQVANSDGTTYLLDFEIAEYYVDDPQEAGGSPSKRISGCWDKVLAELMPKLEKLEISIDVGVQLKEPVITRNQIIGKFAEELIGFAQEFCPEKNAGRMRFSRFSAESYPLLNQYVEKIVLNRVGYNAVRWRCLNIAAANVGIVSRLVSELIRRKAAKTFTWNPGAQKCLLLYASGATVTSRAGAPPPDPSIWDDADLVSACRGSIFDRIYFWERIRKWYKQLK